MVDPSHRDFSFADGVVVLVVHHAFYPMMHLRGDKGKLALGFILKEIVVQLEVSEWEVENIFW